MRVAAGVAAGVFAAAVAGVHAVNHSAAVGGRDSGICNSLHAKHCHGDNLQPVWNCKSHEVCCEACEKEPGCKAWSWDFGASQCFLKTGCSNPKYDEKFHSGIAGGSPSPPPAPGPPPTPSGGPGISAKPKRSDNFFLIIGDWGHHLGGPASCQQKVANMMQAYVAKQQRAGKKCLFVGSLGDNFYYTGLKNEGSWKSVWSDVYGVNDPGSALHDVPWLSVMGNHDLGNDGASCACGSGCNQFNGGHRPSGTDKFWMPDYNWNVFIPGVDLEVIGIDTNSLDAHGLGGDGCHNGAKQVCQQCGSHYESFLHGKMHEGFDLIDKQARSTQAKTALILQHYDDYTHYHGTPITRYVKERFEKANGHKAKVISAYGHRHEQRCQMGNSGKCDMILSGGGGGYQGGAYYGFVAVHLTDDGGFTTLIDSSEVRFSQHSCPKPGMQSGSEEQEAEEEEEKITV
jgi:hypothetical protein